MLKIFVVDSFSWDFGVVVHGSSVVTSEEDSLEERILDKAERNCLLTIFLNPFKTGSLVLRS